MGRPRGSRNATRVDPATRSTIGVRCTMAERDAYHAAAAAAGVPVSVWIRDALRDAAQLAARHAAALAAVKLRATHAAAFAAWIDGGKPSSGPLMRALERASLALAGAMNRTATQAPAPGQAPRE